MARKPKRQPPPKEDVPAYIGWYLAKAGTLTKTTDPAALAECPELLDLQIVRERAAWDNTTAPQALSALIHEAVASIPSVTERLVAETAMAVLPAYQGKSVEDRTTLLADDPYRISRDTYKALRPKIFRYLAEWFAGREVLANRGGLNPEEAGRLGALGEAAWHAWAYFTVLQAIAADERAATVLKGDPSSRREIITRSFVLKWLYYFAAITAEATWLAEVSTQAMRDVRRLVDLGYVTEFLLRLLDMTVEDAGRLAYIYETSGHRFAQFEDAIVSDILLSGLVTHSGTELFDFFLRDLDRAARGVSVGLRAPIDATLLAKIAESCWCYRRDRSTEVCEATLTALQVAARQLVPDLYSEELDATPSQTELVLIRIQAVIHRLEQMPAYERFITATDEKFAVERHFYTCSPIPPA